MCRFFKPGDIARNGGSALWPTTHPKRGCNTIAAKTSEEMSEAGEVYRQARYRTGHVDMKGESNFYLGARTLDRVRTLLRPPWARPTVGAFGLIDDRIIVRRRPTSTRWQPPSWLVRGVLTTVVIATIGFSLQRLLITSQVSANGLAAAGQLDSMTPSAALSPLDVLAPEQQALQPISRQAAIALNSSIPFSTAIVPAASPFVLAGAGEQDRERAAECLAKAIYYEAGGDTPDDQRAVAQVVLNRVRHPLFPKTVCGVVFQGSQLRTGCQFTFTCDGSMSRVPEPRAWARAQVMAADALNGAVFAPVGYATHFHTPWVAPYWAPTLEKIAQVGGHLFYRWPGGAGAPQAFTARYAGGEIAGSGASEAPGTSAPLAATVFVAPASATEAPFVAPRKINVAAVELPLTAPVVAEKTITVTAPPSIVITAGPRLAVKTYHPPVPRGGSAQPLLSRDR